VITLGRASRLIAGTAIALGVLAFATPSQAQNVSSGPKVVPDRDELNVGERVAMTITGFEARSVIMTACGNNARRGSVDCDLRGAQARETNRDGTPTLGSIIVSAPPAPCPCVIRVVSDDNAEVAVAPVTIVGHPVADVVEPTEFVQPLVVEIDAVAASSGFGDRLRSSLGGPTSYEVTVRVRNRDTYAVEDVRATASFTRERYDDTRFIAIDDPGTIEPGDTWEQVVEVDTPSLTIGDVSWQATVSGIGPPIEATDSTSSQPIALFVVGAILLIDLVVLVWRWLARRRRRRAERSADRRPDPFLDESGGHGDIIEIPDADTERREPQLVT
jgi:hypothetical protein